jgi:tryptophan halogenase
MGEKVMTKKIVVIGGGSAGWLTALYIKKEYPDLDLTVVESKEIGILGAGEGTTPRLIEFLETLDIPLSDIVKNCDATIKNGIKFTNWNNDGEFYYHGFALKGPTLLGFDAESQDLFSRPLVLSSIIKNNSHSDVDFIEKISELNKVPFTYKEYTVDELDSHHDKLGLHAIHFDAAKFAARLKQIGIDRNIKIIEKTITDISVNQKNNVDKILFDDATQIECDFVFDCSGFHRLIIGKIFDAKWKSYGDFLPSDSALPFFTDVENDIPPYTEAIAMKYGWMWKIPLQSRFGCGYVYDSSLISEDEAAQEIEEFLGYTPTYPRKGKGAFKFSAGCYEETWVNNCVAIGLAANFIEPLEATSIWISINMLRRLLTNPEWLFDDVSCIRDEFNKDVLSMNNDMSEFIYFHYMSQRKDTDFWKKFTYEKAPESLKQRLNLWKQRFPTKNDGGPYWASDSWLIVGLGIDVISKHVARRYIDNSKKYNDFFNKYYHYIARQNSKRDDCMDHRQFLEGLK